MAHLYGVHTSDGREHEVSTPHHHEDHPAETFKKHLLDVIKGAAGGVVSSVIVRYVYKGRH